jgi:hypothetical protein
MANNHNQVLPGGIFVCQAPFSPGLLSLGWTRPDGPELVRCVCCPVELMATSFRSALMARSSTRVPLIVDE